MRNCVICESFTKYDVMPEGKDEIYPCCLQCVDKAFIMFGDLSVKKSKVIKLNITVGE